MKKYNVYKIISISVIVTILLSFIIPSTTFDSYGNATTSNINPISLIDTFANGITSFSVFLSTFVFILCIGIFYGVLVKTGKYKTVINNTAYKFKDKKSTFVIISALILGIMSAIIGNYFAMLIFVPAFIGILRKLGYDRFTSILATIGSIVLGSTGSLYTIYANQILGSTIADNILFKVIISLISLISIIIFILVFKKPEEVKLEKQEAKKCAHISVIFDIILVLLILGMVPWAEYFGFDGFTTLNESLLEFEVFGVSPYKAFIGSTIAAFGSFTLFDLSVVLLLASVIVALANRTKLNDFMQTLAISLKRALPYALIVVFANIVLVNIYSSGLFYTLVISITKLTDKLFAGSLISALASLAYPDHMYASQFTLSTVTAAITDEKFLVLLSVIFQAIYSLFLLVSPTSVLILLGLQYTNTSYKEWIKYIGKYFLVLFAVLFISLMIISGNFLSTYSIVLLIAIIVLAIVLIFISKNKKEVVTKTEIKEEIKEIKEEGKKEVKNSTTKTTTKKPQTQKKSTTTKKTTTKKTTTTKPSITTPVGLTEEKAHEILLSLKSEYPEGYPWNDNTWSDFHGGNYSGGWGCVGFTYMASDRIFGNLPVTRITDFSKIRVGDIFRYQNGSYGHSVIVLEVKSDRIVVVEGNWQKKVHWNREITFDYMKKYGKYIYTRWPK